MPGIRSGTRTPSRRTPISPPSTPPVERRAATPATLVKTAGGNIARPGYTGYRGNAREGDDEEIAAAVLEFRARGFRHFVAGIDPCTPAALESFARVLELVDRA